MSDALDTVREIGKLVKRSPQRNTKLDKIREETANESRRVHAIAQHDGLFVVSHLKMTPYLVVRSLVGSSGSFVQALESGVTAERKFVKSLTTLRSPNFACRQRV